MFSCPRGGKIVQRAGNSSFWLVVLVFGTLEAFSSMLEQKNGGVRYIQNEFGGRAFCWPGFIQIESYG